MTCSSRSAVRSPPLLILSSVTQYARDLVAADAAVITVSDDVARTLELGASGGRAEHPWVASGLLGPDPVPADPGDPAADPRDRQTVESMMADPRWASHASAPLRGPRGELGTLWFGRLDGRAVTGRDRGFLMTLAELAAIAIGNAQLREADESRAVVAERERIARELHDSLAQVLGVAHLRLRALETRTEVTGAPVVLAEVRALADVCHEAYRDVREAILGLGSGGPSARSFEDSLRVFLERWSEQSGVRAAYDNRLGMPVALSPRTEVHLLRVVQEALTNVRKHAHATRATVTVAPTLSADGRPSTVLTVADDGDGFTGVGRPAPGDGFGLVTMSDRLALLGGSLTVDSAPGRGTRVVAAVPEQPRPHDSPRGASDS